MSGRYAFAIDLDDTTLNTEGKLSDYTKEIFAKISDAGHEIVVASGRALESLPEEILSFPGIRYAITSNGAAIHDLAAKKIMKKYTLKAHTVDTILTLTREDPVVYETFIEGHGFAEADYVRNPQKYGVRSDHGISYIKRTRKPVVGMEAFLTLHKQELDCLDIIIDDQKIKQTIWEKLKKEVPEILITSSVPRMLEIADQNAGKGKAFIWLIEELGILVSDTAAFGNAENDIEMMKAAGVGYAVSNADRECLEAADRVTLSNDEDGVARGMIEFMSCRKGI